ncbi:MAG TPA: hypothetical protein ENI73_00420 [Spirochaetes bacterium]|nr:hypothetical protein [Spirochaetota bacterium]
MLLRFIQKIHRVVGLFAMIFIAFSAITGYFLLHSQDYALSESHVENQWLISLYGKPGKPKHDPFIDDNVPNLENTSPTWEKWLTTIHRGEFFGASIPLVQDFLVLFLILLSLTGPYLWIRGRRGKLFNRKRPKNNLDQLDYITIVDRFKVLKSKEKDILRRLTELHDQIEHMNSHLEQKERIVDPAEISAIEDHVHELDQKTHEIMSRINLSLERAEF